MFDLMGGECGNLLVFVRGLYSGVEPTDVVREASEDGVLRFKPRLDSRVVEVVIEEAEEEEEEEEKGVLFGGNCDSLSSTSVAA